jgi:glycosyltransferase involved in cell wall biosynthesis
VSAAVESRAGSGPAVDWSRLRLGVVSERSVFVDGGLWTGSGTGRLIDALAARCAGLTLAMSASPGRLAAHDHRLAVATEDLVPLPWVPSIARGFFQFRSMRRAIREVERRSDLLIVQLPFAASLALFRPRRPRVYNVYANVRTMVATSTYYRGPKRLAARAAAAALHAMQRRLIARPAARCVTHGDEILAQYGRAEGRAIVSSTVLDREVLSVPRRRPVDAPPRVLFVGFLRHEKGIDTLLAAFRLVQERWPTAELTIVGDTDTVDQGVADELAKAIATLPLPQAVSRLGQLSFGPELFQQYADADVLALPSRSEGTPRVLVEARAFGCPVVASRVGGIPTSVADGVDGLLVPPNDPAALAESLVRVLAEPALRRRLVEEGVRRARECTVEAYAGALLDEAALLLGPEPALRTLPAGPLAATR